MRGRRLGGRRPGTDQAHFAFEHIDKLGQLVQAGFSEEGTDYRDNSGIFFDLKDGAVGFVQSGKLLLPSLCK